jgi:hypothetical protein
MIELMIFISIHAGDVRRLKRVSALPAAARTDLIICDEVTWLIRSQEETSLPLRLQARFDILPVHHMISPRPSDRRRDCGAEPGQVVQQGIRPGSVATLSAYHWLLLSSVPEMDPDC